MNHREKKVELAESIANYVITSSTFHRWSKRQVSLETALVMMEDIGLAQAFLDAIGVPYDVYDMRWTNIEPSIKYGERKWGAFA